MDSSDARQIVILLILLALSAFFSSAETCLTTVNKMRIKSLADDKNKNASLVLKLIEEKTQMLSAILIGNNVVNLSASSLTTTFAMKLAKSSGMSDSVSAITGIATGIITILVLIFGEIIPKSLATMNAERLSLIYAKPIYEHTSADFFFNESIEQRTNASAPCKVESLSCDYRGRASYDLGCQPRGGCY